jgi:hypothetical protein
MRLTPCRSLVLIAGSCLLAAGFVGCKSKESATILQGNPNYRSKILSNSATMTRGSTYSITVCTTNSSALDGATMQTSTYIFLNTSSNLTGAATLTSHLVNLLPKKGFTNWTGNITIPTNRPTGLSYLITIADYLKQQGETNDHDNTNIVAVTIN